MKRKLGKTIVFLAVVSLMVIMVQMPVNAASVSEPVDSIKGASVSGEIIAANAAAGKNLTMILSDAEISIPAGIISFIDKQTMGEGGMNFEIITTDRQLKEGILLRDVIMEQLSSVYNAKMVLTLPDGTTKTITKFPEPLVIKLDLTKAENEAMKADETMMCYITQSGELSGLWSGSLYDKSVTFSTDNLGDFVLMGSISKAQLAWYYWIIFVLLFAGLVLLGFIIIRRKGNRIKRFRK